MCATVLLAITNGDVTRTHYLEVVQQEPLRKDIPLYFLDIGKEALTLTKGCEGYSSYGILRSSTQLGWLNCAHPHL